MTDLLFGDDLDKRIKDLSDAKTITHKLQQTPHRGVHRPGFRGRSFGSSYQRGHGQRLPSRQQPYNHPYSQRGSRHPAPRHTTPFFRREGLSPGLPTEHQTETECQIVPDVRHVSNVSNTPENFTAGKIRFFYSNWTRLTGDTDILQYVRGCCIDFSSEPHKPLQTRSVHYPADRCVILDAEVEKLYNKKVIEKVDNCSEGFFSTIFTRPKKDGSYRLILNLKNLNQCVDTWHFKMETVKTATSLITPNCWFASIDLKDAYYSVSIADSDRKYLKFVWKHSVYQFTCLPNGLASAPRIFTKLLKPLFSTLRKKGHTNLAYLDDSLLVSDSNIDCTHNVSDTVALVDSLGLTLHPDKSVLVPTQEITFLGFVLNSLTMTVSLPSEKKVNIVQMCASLKRKQIVVIRDLAILVGKLVAAEPAVEYAPLYIKTLERDKDRGLRANKGTFEERIRLSRVSLCDLHWWIDNLHTACKWLRRQPPDIVISTDSSKSGWGGIMHDSNLHTGGHWSYVEKNDHINVLELKAAFLVLQSFECACSAAIGQHSGSFLHPPYGWADRGTPYTG